MNIRIYQINMKRDTNNVAFMNYESLPKSQGGSDIDSSIYDKVFEGEVNCKNLEEVYQMFNINHPNGYKARSLSVSDVVEVRESENFSDGFYFCDSFGFKNVSFHSEECGVGDKLNEASEKINVLLVEVGKYPKMIAIDDNLEAMQSLVGGYIEEYMPFEDEVALVCNEEGKMSGLPLNRAIYSEPTEKTKREMIDIIAGKFFICYAPIESEKFESLPNELAKKYEAKFKYPEHFIRRNGNIVAVPYKLKDKEQER